MPSILAYQPRRFGMFSARSLIIVATRLSLIACACSALLTTAASAQTIDLSLNVFYNTPSDINSGGIWQLVAKSSNFGIAGLQARVANVSNALDDAPFATVNGNQTAGFYEGDRRVLCSRERKHARLLRDGFRPSAL